MNHNFPHTTFAARPGLYGSPTTFWDTVEIELSGHAGFAGYLRIEVEFTAERDTPPQPWNDDPGAAGEREIIAVRPFEYLPTPHGLPGTERKYLDCSPALADYFKEAIDVDALTADWSE